MIETIGTSKAVAPRRATIQCVTCETHTRVYRTEPAMRVGAYRYCPVCGSADVRVYLSSAAGHWEALARDYGLSVAVVQQIYNTWEPQTGEKFGDYVGRVKEEARAHASVSKAT